MTVAERVVKMSARQITRRTAIGKLTKGAFGTGILIATRGKMTREAIASHGCCSSMSGFWCANISPGICASNGSCQNAGGLTCWNDSTQCPQGAGGCWCNNTWCSPSWRCCECTCWGGTGGFDCACEARVNC